MTNREIEHLSKNLRTLRKFGLLVGGIFLLLGCWSLYRQKPAWPYLLTPGALLVSGGVIAPGSLKHVYIAWMNLGLVLGFVVSNVILTAFYYLIVTPIGLIARVCGQDFLSLKRPSAATSYWVMKPVTARTPQEYEQQF
jgi:hypothetical protein